MIKPGETFSSDVEMVYRSNTEVYVERFLLFWVKPFIAGCSELG